jgi:nucleoside-diphosphate-sugar epimerase
MAFDPVDIAGKKILITGPTGQVALPVVEQFAKQADVYALARFSNTDDRGKIEAMGVKTLQADLADDDLGHLPTDFDYVINFAVVKSGQFDYDLRANAEGVGRLMMQCKNVKAFLHFSSTGVYQYQGQEPLTEQSPLGDNHRMLFPTYSISKIAAETVVRFVARQFAIPAVIARLNVPYGDTGGWPFWHLLMMKEGIPIDVHPERPNYYNPIHADDYIEKIPRLLAAASTEVRTLNFGGSQRVAIEQWCDYLGERCGLKPVYRESDQAFGSLWFEPEKMHELVGPTSVDWREGMVRMVKSLAPQMLKN